MKAAILLLIPTIICLSNCAYHYRDSAYSPKFNCEVPVDKKLKQLASNILEEANAPKLVRIISAQEVETGPQKRLSIRMRVSDGSIWRAYVQTAPDIQVMNVGQTQVTTSVFKPHSTAFPVPQ